MKRRYLALLALVALALITASSIALTNSASAKTAPTLPDVVRQATAPFKDFKNLPQGYALLHGCVSGPQEGAMGVHYANGELVGDGALDAQHPEALLYETKNGKQQLVGVEYVVLADAWNSSHQMPPVLMGQLFNLVGTPNRYGLPAFYELHVWAWKDNPDGMFADWNPKVSCEEYIGSDEMHDNH